ncbi:MAG: hypothetical protein JST48_00370 [Bacteroidetes bacterium]|nr:hypothetical protein [Bacteroidota bacterium]
MKKLQYVLFLLMAGALLKACVSGKAALKQGDYYDAVLESVKRLRESVKNKKATQVLTQAYPLAIDFIDTGIQNGIKSDDPRKWRNAVEGYQKINFINDQIKTSLGAMKIITNPQTRFKELADAKDKAADEAYNEGINFMMKATRNDYKQAYYDFKDANNYEMGFKESVEMMNQAEFNATLRVAYEETNNSRFNYGSFQPVVSSLQRLFLSFKPVAQKDTVPPQQYLKITFNGYQQNRPSYSSNAETLSKQVVTGQQKGADGKMQNVYKTVTAQVTYYHKLITATAYANITITDAANNAVLQNLNLDSPYNWSYDWASYQGDKQALSGNASTLVQRKEAFPNDQNLFNQTINNLQGNVSQQLKSFYSQY